MSGLRPTIDPRQVWANPDWHLHRLYLRRFTAGFVHHDRSDSVFIDADVADERADERQVALEFALDQLADCSEPAEEWLARLRMVFFIPYSCSTLLLRSIRALTGARVLAEPLALGDVASAWRVARRRSMSVDEWRPILELTVALLSRGSASEPATVIKPHEGSNLLIQPLLELEPRMNAVLLYSSLSSYLAAVLPRQERRQADLELAAVLAADEGWAGCYDPANCAHASALVWLHNTMLFQRALGDPRHRPRLLPLNCDALLAEPVAALSAVCSHFQLPADDSSIQRFLDRGGHAFHAKAGPDQRRRYGRQQRAEALERARVTYAIEIADAQHWVDQVAAGLGIVTELGEGVARALPEDL